MTTANSDFRRADGRAVDEMRKVTITRGFTDNPAGSVLVTFCLLYTSDAADE